MLYFAVLNLQHLTTLLETLFSHHKSITFSFSSTCSIHAPLQPSAVLILKTAQGNNLHISEKLPAELPIFHRPSVGTDSCYRFLE